MSIHPAPDTIELGESVVDEVRAIREALDQAVGHDVRRLAEQAREVGERIRREHGLTIAPQTKQE